MFEPNSGIPSILQLIFHLRCKPWLIEVVSLVELCNLSRANSEIVHVVCSVKSVRVVDAMDLGCFVFFFFFSLRKNKCVICCIIFRFIKLIVYTIYGTPRFLVVTCLFSSNETILLRTIN